MQDGMYPKENTIAEKPSKVEEPRKPKVNVSMTNDKDFKTVLTVVANNLTMDMDPPEGFDETQIENFTTHLYTSFVDRITLSDAETGEERSWLVFSDDGYIKPMRKTLPNITKRQTEDTYIVLNPNDKDNDAVMIEESFLQQHFYEIVNDALIHYGSDEDITNFVIAYVKDEFVSVPEIFDQDTFSFSQYFAYLVDAYHKEKVLYFQDADLYSDRRLGNAQLNIHVVQPFGQPPYLVIGIPVNFEINGEFVLRRINQLVPILSEYDVDDCGIERPSKREITKRIEENKEYMRNLNRYQVYEGLAQVPGFMKTRDLYVNTRVMVDMGALYFVDPERLGGLLGIINSNLDGAQIDKKVSKKSSGYSDLEYMALSKSVVCYDLTKKQWFIGHRDNLREINFRKDAFEKLQMDSAKKNIIRKICSSDNVEKGNNIDFIDSKGGGNIFLLHGVPGTGKTLTAEAISELLERPLYKVNISEFDSLSELEQGIETSLRYAERWNATLLIDEADVALEKRDSTNIERNAIVAVFLRLIEYYSGTMFLTSNRANEFDDAFKSRITFAIHYQSPNTEVKTAIWTNILEGVETDMTKEQIAEVAQYDINGRQIKNIINTATFMSDDGSARHEDVMVVLEQTMEFENFLKKE